MVKQGWPPIIQDLPPELKPFWTFCEVITIADRLLIKGDKITVPEKARKKILKQICHGHLGIQKCLQQAKATVYWHGIYDELKTLISSCTICLRYSPANSNNSKSITASLGHEVPTTPWAKLASDIFTFNNKNHLLTIDYMSCFPVICMFQSMTATHVTVHMKAIFSEYGVPKSIVTDNGPCYSSEYFKEMMKKMGIHHITTSPHHHQSN